MYQNSYSPRGVIDYTSSIYKIIRENYGVRVSHIDITQSVPGSFLNNKDLYNFKEKGYCKAVDFGGADSVLWVTENLVNSASTKIVDSLTEMLA